MRERQELRVTEFFCPEPLPRMVFAYIEILGRLGKEQIFFFFAGYMGGNLEFSFVHVDLKCLLDIK